MVFWRELQGSGGKVTASNITRILVVDDESSVRCTLHYYMMDHKDIEIIAFAKTGQEAIDLTLQLKPDILVLDMMLPGISGVEVCRHIRKTNPDVKILGISGHNERSYIEQMINAGASGFLNKMRIPEMPEAVRTLMSGKQFFCRTTSHIMDEPDDREERPENKPLSMRQLQVLQLLAKGMGVKQIADQLNISKNTVKTYIKQLKEKLGEHTLTGLVKHAFERHLIS